MTTKVDNENTGLLLTLNRGIRVLEEIANERGKATAKALSADLGINLGTCYQLLRTLQANGYVNRLPGGRYGLGSRVGYLIDRFDIESAPPPAFIDILEALHKAVEETVYVSLRRGAEVPIVAVREGTKALRVGNLGVGYSGHPHVRASTKVMLAFGGPTAIDELIPSHDLEALTPNTITEWDAFLAELDTTRERGYATDIEEFAIGVSCIGTVILDDTAGPVGAYGISFPVTVLEEDGTEIAREMLRAGERASRELGYDGAYPPTVVSE